MNGMNHIFFIWAITWMSLDELLPSAEANRATIAMIQSNVSELLDKVLIDYEKTLRPGFAGKCGVVDEYLDGSFLDRSLLNVQISMSIRTLGPLSEQDGVSENLLQKN
jgi:hypothetical protein